MKQEEKIICDFIHEFVNCNWDKINLNRCEITQSRQLFLRSVKKEIQTALWVLMEVAVCGLHDRNLRPLDYIFVDNPEEVDFGIIKIKDKYIKLQWIESTKEYFVSFCEPKEKLVIYFE